jgi:RNA polymerase sigma-70 factor (ECF subfamily)
MSKEEQQVPLKKSLDELISLYSSDEYQKLSDLLIEKEFVVLLEQCAQEMRAAQKKLYYIFYHFAINICLRYTSNKDEAIEIMNDGFLKVFSSIKKYHVNVQHPINSFKAWMKKIMIFTAIDAFRKNERSIATVNLDTSTDIALFDNNLPDNIAYKDVMACIMQLSPAYRAVFCMCVIDGFTHEEVAAKLGIAVGTSKSNLAKARIQLQKMLLNIQNFNSYEQRAV